MHSRIEMMPISRFVSCPWAREEGCEDIVESFARGAQAQLQNLVGRILPSGKVEVLAGARRWAAAAELGWAHLEIKILECDDREAELVFWEENLRRKGLKGKLEARGVARLKQLLEPACQKRGGDRSKGRNVRLSAVTRIAKASGRSERQVRRLVAVGQGGTTTRDPRELVGDRLRSALRLAARCIEDLGSLNAELREEVRRFLDRCRALPELEVADE